MTRKGPEDDRDEKCTTGEPRGGRGAARPHVAVLRPEGVRGRGDEARPQRADVGGGRRGVRGRLRGALRGAHELPQRLQAPHAQDRGGRRRARGAQAQEGHLLPGVGAVEVVARGGQPGRAGGGGLRQRRVDQGHVAAGREPGGVLAVGLRGLQAHLRARRPGGGAALAGPLLSEHQQGGSSPAGRAR